ncbi:MAG: glycoside hydrolase family 10 protein [Massilimicrobiota timonensis]
MKKKKHSLFVIIILLCICVLIYIFIPHPPCSLLSFDKRAVWFSYGDLEQFSYKSQKDFEKDFSQAIENIKKYHMNTVIVQVRAFSDALYDSKLFPVSKVITHQESLSFDPLQSMIDIAHQNDMSIEAWVNPYRISLNRESFEQFLNESPHHQWLEDASQTIGYATYQYIFNPASQSVRDYIVDGVREIVENYDVDGIHFDDYFYVAGTHDGTTQNQRMDYVNMLIQDVYQTIKSIDDHVVFGISPQGNYENCISDGADIDTWLSEEGYIDYLMPQIYWSDQYGEGNEAMFTKRCQQFADIPRHQSVILYAGLALYRAGNGEDEDYGWQNRTDNISSQVQILYEHGYKGFSLFRYGSFLQDSAILELESLIHQHM